jgi:hypothetical protein
MGVLFWCTSCTRSSPNHACPPPRLPPRITPFGLLAFRPKSHLSGSPLASALKNLLHTAASGHGDAVVALKCVVALEIMLARDAFIISDQLVVAHDRHPPPSPLALAAS